MISQNHLKLAVLFLVAAHPNLTLAGHYTWTPLLEKAYRQATSLRLKEAEKTLARVAASDPHNLIALHVANYLDFFRVYIDEDEEEFKQLEKNRDARLKRIEQEGNPRSPWHKFLLADIRLQWALARLKFEQFSTAFFETNKAFKLLTENVRTHPDFMPNYKDLGILHAMAGTVPDNYRWAMEWFTNLEGTLEQGRGELQKAINYAKTNDFIYEEEVNIYYAYLLLHLGNDAAAAWDFLNKAQLKPSENPLHCFVMANIAMRTGKGHKAIQLLEAAPSGPEFHPFWYLEYLLGLAKLQALDFNAEKHLLRYVNNFKGFNFVKDAYQKLAWCRLLKGDVVGYQQYMTLCRTKGKTLVDSDKSAWIEAEEGVMPVVELLKARLLFDGGYYDKALAVLQAKESNDFFSFKNRLEYLYRKARIVHALHRYEEALTLYDAVISEGKDAPWYFACRAALEKGHLYEAIKQKALAIKAFEQCLSMNPKEHKTGLHQQAKAGLLRMR